MKSTEQRVEKKKAGRIVVKKYINTEMYRVIKKILCAPDHYITKTRKNLLKSFNQLP
jgi:hypothetical protein